MAEPFAATIETMVDRRVYQCRLNMVSIVVEPAAATIESTTVKPIVATIEMISIAAAHDRFDKCVDAPFAVENEFERPDAWLVGRVVCAVLGGHAGMHAQWRARPATMKSRPRIDNNNDDGAAGSKKVGPMHAGGQELADSDGGEIGFSF